MSSYCDITVPVTVSLSVPAGTPEPLVKIARKAIKTLMKSCGVGEWADWANTIKYSEINDDQFQEYIQEAVEAIREKASPGHKTFTCKTDGCSICDCSPHGLTESEQKILLRIMKSVVSEIVE